MRIIVDAMGGDNAPEEIVKGAAMAVEEFDIELILVGNERKIRGVLEANKLSGRGMKIVHTDKVLTMEDSPVLVLKEKRDSSMGVAFSLLAEDKGDAIVCAGNTGAMLAASTFMLKRINGIKRAAIGVVLPFQNKTLLIDAGANIDVKAAYMRQFAFMGSIYMKNIFGISNPTVGLANNGAEETKGTSLHIETHKLLRETKTINFVGNIEGRDIPTKCSDVLVTDGFTGNMILKLTEGFGSFLNKKLKEIFLKDMFTKAAALVVRGSFSQFKSSLDQSEYGGAPLIGVRKPVIKAHGSANAKAIKNAIRQAVYFTKTGIVNEIERQTVINK